MSIQRKLSRLFFLQWSRQLQYRLDTLLWALSEAATPLLAMAIWYAVAKSSQGPLSPRDAITYYLLVIFVYAITNAWNGFFMAQDILNGKIVQNLTKPIAVIWFYIVDNIAEKIFKLLIPLPLFVGALLLFSQYFSPSIFELPHILLFIFSLLLAVVINFAFDISLGMVAFWLEDAMQLRGYSMLLQQVGSGILIPLALLPPMIATVFSWLPFRYMISAPIELLMGSVAGSDAYRLLVTQITWLIALLFIATVMWRRGLRRYEIPGQ